jgi:aspartate/methionine/tyrosine aminotransferase
MLFNPSIVNTTAYALTELHNRAIQLKEQGIDIINATIGDPKDDTPESIPQALSHALTRQSYSQYPPYIGSQPLRQAIAHWAHREYAIDLNPNDHIVACNGTKEAIFSFPLLFDWSDNAVIAQPSLSYPVYHMSALYHHIPMVSLPLSLRNGFLPDLDAIPDATLQKIRLLWINSPHNPTTTIASKAYLTQLVALAEKYNFIVCSDECYNDLYDQQKPASIMEIDSIHWVCFRSLSKRSHMTGYRSGAIISQNKDLIQWLKKMRSPMGVGTPSFIQEAAIWAWSDDRHVDKHRALYNTKRTRLKQALNQAGLSVFGGNAGFYMWVKSPKYSTSESLSQWFLDHRIMVTPGTTFGDDGNPYIRLVFCLRDDELNRLIDQLAHDPIR